MNRHLPYVILTLALLAAASRAYFMPTPPISSREVAYPIIASADTNTAVNLSTFLPQRGASAHAATITELPDGTIACAWFSGTREGAADVAIYLSFQQNGNWSQPIIIADRLQTEKDLARHIRKVGNPVLACDAGGRLHLWYVSVSVGGWATSAVNHQMSWDGGKSWSRAKRLVTAPFFNMSTQVRTPPLPLKNGGFILPTNHELFTKHGEMTRLDAEGIMLYKQRIPANQPMDQPAMALLPERAEILTLLRDPGREPRRIGVAAFSDAAKRWLVRPSLPIANPDSSVALLRLQDGRLLLACNPLQSGRYKLALLLSEDAGLTWHEALIAEESLTKNAEFSYPTLLQSKDGMIHIVYTWDRLKIAHRLISTAALAANPARID
jgi:predicted neuraminidase